MSTWHDTDFQPADDDSEPIAGHERGGLHPVNVTHLVMGIAFAGVVAIWAAYTSGAADGADLRWLLPFPWLAAGAAGLAAALLASRRTHGARTDGP